MHTNVLVLLTLGAFAAAPATALADDLCYDAEVIPAIDTPWDVTLWSGINDRGDLVGRYCAQTSTPCVGFDADVRGAIYDAAKGTITSFTAPEGYNYMQMAGMNDSGVVVGTAVQGNGRGGIANAAAFIYRRGVATVFDDPMEVGYWAATDINASGTIVGYSMWYIDEYETWGRIGWILDKHGEVTPLLLPHVVRTVPFGINDRGDVVGYFMLTDGYEGAFVYTAEGEFEIVDGLDGPPYYEYIFYGINNEGTAVGLYIEYDADLEEVERGALVWPYGGDPEYLNVLDYDDTQFFKINDAEHVVGGAGGLADGIHAWPCK